VFTRNEPSRAAGSISSTGPPPCRPELAVAASVLDAGVPVLVTEASVDLDDHVEAVIAVVVRRPAVGGAGRLPLGDGQAVGSLDVTHIAQLGGGVGTRLGVGQRFADQRPVPQSFAGRQLSLEQLHGSQPLLHCSREPRQGVVRGAVGGAVQDRGGLGRAPREAGEVHPPVPVVDAAHSHARWPTDARVSGHRQLQGRTLCARHPPGARSGGAEQCHRRRGERTVTPLQVGGSEATDGELGRSGRDLPAGPSRLGEVDARGQPHPAPTPHRVTHALVRHAGGEALAPGEQAVLEGGRQPQGASVDAAVGGCHARQPAAYAVAPRPSSTGTTLLGVLGVGSGPHTQHTEASARG